MIDNEKTARQISLIEKWPYSCGTAISLLVVFLAVAVRNVFTPALLHFAAIAFGFIIGRYRVKDWAGLLLSLGKLMGLTLALGFIYLIAGIIVTGTHEAGLAFLVLPLGVLYSAPWFGLGLIAGWKLRRQSATSEIISGT